MRDWAYGRNWVLTVLLLFPAAAAAQSPGTFAYTGSLNIPRDGHTATLLDDGTVLIAGGQGSNGGAVSAEIYSPSSGAFTLSGSLNYPRLGHSATLLNNGEVLIVGGSSTVSGAPVGQAELYNPTTRTFTVTGTLNTPRVSFTATLLDSGNVLVVGGQDANDNVLTSAEIYNPSTGTFTVTGSLGTPRHSHTATLLNTGMVLVAGGVGVTASAGSAELYNPSTGTFTATGALNTPHADPSATLLDNGLVLVAGGNNGLGLSETADAQLYSPSAGTFAATGSLNTARDGQTAVLLTNGTVLVAGGAYYTKNRPPLGGYTANPLASAELYNPSTGTFSLTGAMNTARRGHTATLLSNGKVLVVGGWGPLGTAELYEPTTTTPAGLLSIALSPLNQWTPIGNSQTFTATGTFSGNVQEILASAIWTSSDTAVATVTNDSSNYGHAYGVASGSTTIEACVGSVCASATMTITPHTNLLLGSESGDDASGTFEYYNDTPALQGDGNLNLSRSNHSAVLLRNGTVFVAGGVQNSTSWQILSIDGAVLSSGSLTYGIESGFGVLLGNGNVFLGGGLIIPGNWEIYDPNGNLVGSGALNGNRTPGASAVVLQNGNVWISGSAHTKLGGGEDCTWEIHSPSGSLLSSNALTTCFSGGKVALLSNGDVILLGGDDAPGTYEIYTQAGVYVRTGSTINGFNHGASAVALDGGAEIFIFGSCEFGGSCTVAGAPGTWEILGFDANANQTSDNTGSLEDSRDTARAVVTSAGNILITGGNLAPGTWEMWTPSGTAATFDGAGNLFNTRYGGHSDTHF